ncbi:MAG: hypothetical protein HYU39_08185 [Thaumarchaeota archaeon]|nr:hypothetical protein [Nitrososphaerota archaeon]
MQKTSFSDALIKSIKEGLEEALGATTARAIEFYVDPSIAISNIAEYTASLRKLFPAGVEPIEKKIAEKLYSNLGFTFTSKQEHGLQQYVDEAKQKVSG